MRIVIESIIGRVPLRTVFAVWLAAEICAFFIAVSLLGVSGALLLGLLTSLIGISQLRRLGRDAAINLRQAFGQGRVVQGAPAADSMIAAAGGILLILPGFFSDMIGLALSAPSVRLWIAGRVGQPQKTAETRTKPSRDHVIDLNAGEWRRLDESKPI